MNHRPEGAAADRLGDRPATLRRRRRSAVFVAGAVVAVLVGLGGYGAVQAGGTSTTSRGWDASTRRLEAEAEAYAAAQANVARGRAADAARLQASAIAFAAGQDDLARGRAADSARLQAAADAAG